MRLGRPTVALILTDDDEKGQLAVDPVNDLVAIGIGGADASHGGSNSQPQILIFNRDQGNAKPRAVVAGPNTGLMNFPNLRAYPAKGWLLALMVASRGTTPHRR